MKLLILLITLYCLINNISTAEFLEESKIGNYIQIEFTSTCGNSYITNQRVSGDITNEIKKKGLTHLEIKTINNNSKTTLDKNYNIFYVKNGATEKILIATSNSMSDKYKEILENYPMKLVIRDNIPATDEIKIKRDELVNGIIKEIRGIENL